MPSGLPSEVERSLARQPISTDRKLRWRAHAGYARIGGGVLIHTPSREARLGGSRAFGLLQWLEPRLRGEHSLDEIVRPLPPDGARTVSDLVAHLVRLSYDAHCRGHPYIRLFHRPRRINDVNLWSMAKGTLS